MKIKLLSFSAFAAILIFIGCKKVENGFLSDTIRYINSIAIISRGAQSSTSAVINPDGSTAPVSYEYSNLKDSTGKAVSDSFFLKYPVFTWKDDSSYVWKTDTTEAIIDKKRDSTNLQPISFNGKTGAWTANAASLYLPLGDYKFDIKANNSWGSKTYPEFGTLRIQDLTASDYWTNTISSSITHYKLSGTTGTLPANTAPTLTLVRTSPLGHVLHVIIVDKNGTAFDPSTSEVRYYSKTSTTYTSFEYYSKIHAPTYENKQYNIDYYITPYPYQLYKMWFYLLYSYTGDNATATASSLYSIWGMGFQIKEPGTYTLTVQFTNLTHK